MVWVLTLSTLLLLLIQSVYLPLNFTILCLILGLIFLKKDRWYLWSFALGLISDLIEGRLLGSTSIIFLVLTLAYVAYSKKCNPNHPIFLFIFCLLSDILCRKLWNIGSSLPVLMIISGLCLVVGLAIGQSSKTGKIRLSV
jgi:hypothetical protein